MKYYTSAEIAQKWGVSPRTIRNYYTNQRIILKKIWTIPVNVTHPE